MRHLSLRVRLVLQRRSTTGYSLTRAEKRDLWIEQKRDKTKLYFVSHCNASTQSQAGSYMISPERVAELPHQPEHFRGVM